jgi:hypothetical protein
MAVLDNTTKRKFEKLFDMGGGYVLDFSNASFADFIKSCIDFDPYEKYPEAGSKARTLRTIWDNEPASVIAKLLLEMLDYWKATSIMQDREISRNDEILYEDLKTRMSDLAATQPFTDDEQRFLQEDFSSIEPQQLAVDPESQEIIEQRLSEIDKCIDANAPLAVIFLVGSTLEGLLQEVAQQYEPEFKSADKAPHDRRTTKPLPIDKWSLNDLIDVSGEIGILSRDVQGHATQVRKFRNYIHPARQKKEKFSPRIETARIAQQVLKAAIIDLSRASHGECK